MKSLNQLAIGSNMKNMYKEREAAVSQGRVGSWQGQVVRGNLYPGITEILLERDGRTSGFPELPIILLSTLTQSISLRILVI